MYASLTYRILFEILVGKAASFASKLEQFTFPTGILSTICIKTMKSSEAKCFFLFSKWKVFLQSRKNQKASKFLKKFSFSGNFNDTVVEVNEKVDDWNDINDSVKNNALDLSVLQYAVNSAIGDMDSMEEAMSNI